MNVQSSTSVSQAMASYAAQLQAVRSREQFPEEGPKDPSRDAPAADQVTLTPERDAEILRAAASEPAAPPPPPLLDEDDQVAMTSKSITRALEAYVQVSTL